MKKIFTLHAILFIFFFAVITLQGWGQVTGDFQTKNATGNWSDFNAWNIYNGSSWIAATSGQIPTATSSVFVQTAHTISVDNAGALCNDLNANGATTSKVAFSAATSVLNVKGNMVLFSAAHNCFGTWTAGAKIVFSGIGAQGFTNLSANSVFVNIEVNKSSGTLTTSSNFRFGSFTLTSGNFLVGSGYDVQGNASASTINVNGGTWTQNSGATRINNAGTSNSPIGAVTINGGTMVLATSSTSAGGGFQITSIDIKNAGTLKLEYSTATGNTINILNSISVDATSTLNTAFVTTPLPPSVSFNGIVNYYYTGAQTISAATYSYLKLSGTNTKTLAGSTTIAANGTLEMGSSATLGSNTLNVDPTNTTLLYSSGSNQTATNNEWNDNFQNITVNSGGTVSMAGLGKTINGTLALTSGTLNIGASGSLNLNGPLVSTSGLMTGTNTSDLAITGTTGGAALLPISGNISLRNVAISGNRTLQMNGTSNINLSGSFTIATGATYDNGGESQIINGGGGSISITGKFITKDAQGFFATNAAIPGITPALNPGCTIEYGLLGDQAVQGSTVSYENVTFSGSGIKTLASATAPKGTVYITGSAIVQAGSHTFGDNGTAPFTNLTMDGGRLIMSGTNNPQPHMTGTYNLTGGVVEFACSSVSGQTVRNTTYNVIEITGTNVGNSLGNINLVSGGSFIVKSGGKFNINADQITGATGPQSVVVASGAEFQCGNANGFSGGDGSVGNSTAIKSDIETISLANGSTVNYMRSGNQIITNQLPYTNLTLSGTGNKTAPAGILWLVGDFTKSGTSTFVHNNGTILFGGFASQAYSATTPLTFYNVTNSNAVGLSINSDLIIVRQLTLNANSKTALISGNITLKSDATNTANVAEIPVSATITYGGGFFIPERYFSAKRAWRFLSVPTDNTQTVKEAWQEGAVLTADNPVPGYGTQITNNISGWAAAGFDYYSPNGPSAKKFDAVNNVWTGIGSTAIPIKTTEGIMTFIRGDRTANSLNAPASPTALRTKGQLYTGTQPPVTVTTGKFASIGNPYASALDMRKISIAGGVDRTFYIWDPKLTGLGFGAYQTFKLIGTDFYPTPGFGSYSDPSVAYNYIQSGQAFFVTASASNGSITIMENAKVSADSPAVNNTSVFRSMTSGVQLLRTTLYGVNADGTVDVMDGVLNLFGDNYSNSIDENDAVKANNFSENLAIKKEPKLLAIEARSTIAQNDTILYNMTKMKTATYQFEFIASNLAQPGVTAFLQDNYSNISTPLDLAGSTLYSFNVTSDTGTSKPGRFRVIFINTAAGPLPITFSFVKAYEQNMDISVEWKIENEKNMKEYVVEKSVDGRQFIQVISVEATGNNGNTVNYQWTDISPVTGNNYYRIRSVGLNGQPQYSTIVKVTIGTTKPQISVYPNPIVNGIIHLQLINQPKGKYYIRLLNNSGQVILTTQVQHEQGNSTQTIPINKTLGSGNYLLEVKGSGRNKTIIKVSK